MLDSNFFLNSTNKLTAHCIVSHAHTRVRALYSTRVRVRMCAHRVTTTLGQQRCRPEELQGLSIGARLRSIKHRADNGLLSLKALVQVQDTGTARHGTARLLLQSLCRCLFIQTGQPPMHVHAACVCVQVPMQS